MKCGKDLDAVKSAEVPSEILEPEAFTPAAAGEDARLASTTSSKPKPAEQPSDIETYKRRAATSIRSYESQAVTETDEPPEIQLSGVTSDFMEKKRYCEMCGVANPHEQRYCKQCGAALQSEVPSDADIAYNARSMVPLAAEPVEATLLTDVSPSAPASDYFSDGATARTATRRFRAGGGSRGVGVRELLIAMVIVVVLGAIIYLFAFGGYDRLLGGRTRKVHSAGTTMEKLPSVQYDVTATFETGDGVQYPGSGKVLREAPDKTYWEMSLNVPGKPRAVASMQIGKNVYVNGPSWQTGDPKQAAADVRRLWRDFSSVEDLGTQVIGTADC